MTSVPVIAAVTYLPVGGVRRYEFGFSNERTNALWWRIKHSSALIHTLSDGGGSESESLNSCPEIIPHNANDNLVLKMFEMF